MVIVNMSQVGVMMAAMSLRSGNQPMDVPPVDAEVAGYFV